VFKERQWPAEEVNLQPSHKHVSIRTQPSAIQDSPMGSLKKRRKAKISKHKRRKRMRANRHKKRLRYKA
jgi:hypothetical protein